MNSNVTVLESTTYYNQFCLKLSCFTAFFGEVKGQLEPCLICGKTDDVVCDFGEEK
ncbi:MAG: hypothetical protein KAJ19_03280 [Gammaproteobacteria bacterium]|nr:hypothetical protein [Gammaproteobacteria bacterium]